MKAAEMELKEYFERFSSDCTAGSANQKLTENGETVTLTGRCPYMLSHGGENYSLLFGGATDSTFGESRVCTANAVGDPWTILSMRVGIDQGSGEPEVFHTVTFGGSGTRTVDSPDLFCTDPIPLNAKAGDRMIYEITISGRRYPYHEEIVLPAVIKGEDGSFRPGKTFPVPLMIGSDRPVSKRVGFLGDSITQGCGTEVDSYTHWAAKIAEGLPDDISVWDLGIGYARAYDAATDSLWLYRAKQCDTVNVCLGVNDLLRDRTADEVISDITAVVRSLKKAGCRVILFTVPPFDMTGEAKERWYAVCGAVRGYLGREADDVFDFADVLGRPAPERHMSIYGGHPNAEGCAVLAKAYLKAGLI